MVMPTGEFVNTDEKDFEMVIVGGALGRRREGCDEFDPVTPSDVVFDCCRVCGIAVIVKMGHKNEIVFMLSV